MSLQAALDLLLGSQEPLQEIAPFVWQNLAAGAASNRHPWNEGSFSTVEIPPTGPPCPKTRTVILRHADQASRSIDCYTDVRSAKVIEMQSSSPRVCWLFYQPSSKVQLRLEGDATVIDGPEADDAWQATPLRSREAYLSLATPGHELADAQPPSTGDRSVDAATSERGRENFRIVRTTITGGDLLYLRRKGHVRAQFEYDSDGRETCNWLVP